MNSRQVKQEFTYWPRYPMHIYCPAWNTPVEKAALKN